jgi:uncharacterized membrane protein (UPF0127 family)
MSRRAGAVVLRREADGQVLCEHCVVADTALRRMRGLLGRRELPRGEGIVLRPGWSIHTAFMRFPIDVVFVDADQVVLRVVPSLRPWRAAVCRGSHDVVELASGECVHFGLETGDRVTWAARPERPPVSIAGPSSGDGRARLGDRSGEPTRVLLGTCDDRFLRLARFLLTRNDFDVAATKRIVRAIDLVERHRPDVVVIDATDALGDAARTVAAIEALHPDVGVVVVCDGEPPRWTNGLKVTEKWAALETLPKDIRLLAAEPKAWS